MRDQWIQGAPSQDADSSAPPAGPDAEPRAKPTVDIVLSAHGITRFLTKIVCGLTACYTGAQVLRAITGHDYLFGIVPKFNLDAENNVPTWYSSLALLLAATVSTVIGLGKRAASDRFARHWLVLGGIFVFLSLDEAASIHEMTHTLLRPLFAKHGFFGGYLWFPWVIAWTAFTMVVAVTYIRFMRHLPATTRGLFLLAATLFVTGAVGLEIVGAPYWFYERAASFKYAALAGVEEVLEMSGIVVFNFAALRYFEDHYLGLRILFG